LPFALTLSRVAAKTVSRALGSGDKAQRLVLSLFFRAVLGIERIFHFEAIDDVGFALLTGGRRVLSRTTLGGLVRAVTTRGARAFSRATEHWSALKGKVVTLSLDEHSIARFTRKFRIAKGYHTIRNKHMRLEKVTFLYWPSQRLFLRLIVTKANAKLAVLAAQIVPSVRRHARPAQLRLVLDSAAAQSHAALCRLHRFRKTVFIIRAPRRPAYVRAWKQLPRDSFTTVDEPGRYVGAKPKRIDVTETTTAVAGLAEPVRTIVVREHARRGKDRWHALFVLHDLTTAPLDLVHEFRTRQHHEQGYRIGAHDLALDTAPSGYPKDGRPDRPGFRQGPLHLCAWLAAMAWHAVHQFTASLPPRLQRAQPRALRRWVLIRTAELFVTPSHLLVVLAPAPRCLWLRPLFRKFNQARATLPWFAHRRVVLGFAPTHAPPPDAKPVLEEPDLPEIGSGRAEICASVWC
jgi:hypothetical protein